MIYIIIVILLVLYIWYRIELSKRRKLSERKLKYTRDIEYIIRVIKSCNSYKQLVSLNKWWHIYLKNSHMFAVNYFKTIEDRNRIENVFNNKLIEIQNKEANVQRELLNQTPIKLTKQQVDNLKEKVENSKDTFLRKGQMYFNELYNMNPQLADSIRSSSCDPFYDDSRIDKFLNKISE
jgi:hypothetical protein